jgi:hypothetical protein
MANTWLEDNVLLLIFGFLIFNLIAFQQEWITGTMCFTDTIMLLIVAFVSLNGKDKTDEEE